MSTPSSPVLQLTAVEGDGAGPAAMEQALRTLEKLGVRFHAEHAVAGTRAYEAGDLAGVSRDCLESARRTRRVLKGPLDTRAGTGERGQGRVLHALLDTFIHVCPVRPLPGTQPVLAHLDVTLMHEESEGIQPAMEARHTPTVVHTGLQVSRAGTLRFARAAASFTRALDARGVACVTGFQRPLMADALFREGVDEVARAAEMAVDHWSADEAAEAFTSRRDAPWALWAPAWHGPWAGSILAALAGGQAGLCSAHLGEDAAVFEPRGGPASTQGATTVGMLMAASLLLRHADLADQGVALEHAVVAALAADTALWGASAAQVGDAVRARVGQRMELWRALPARAWPALEFPDRVDAGSTVRRVVGVDVWLESQMRPDDLAQGLEAIVRGSAFKLKALSQRGTRAFPGNTPVHQPHDLWCARFTLRETGAGVLNSQVLELLVRVATSHRWTHVFKLQDLAGTTGYGRPYSEEG